MLNNRQIELNWHEIKSQILKHWDKLSAADVEKTYGESTKLASLVHEKYGSNSKFEKEYEKICMHVANKNRSTKEPNKYSIDDEVFNEMDLDDEDEDGMSNFDNHSANYTGISLSEKDIEEMLQPDFDGVGPEEQVGPLKEVELPIKPNIEETGINQQPDKKTAPDEFTPNHAPQAHSEDITLGRSNSSANTTSPSALSSSDATFKL